MSELPWFERRAESLGDILVLAGSYRIDSLVVAIEGALLAKSSPSEPERVVLAVEALEREVNSGGYAQFFSNSAEYVPIIVQALRTIDCPDVAAITADAIAVLKLPAGAPAAEVERAAAGLSEADDALLSELDDRFFEYPDPIEDRLFAYIADHRHEITLP